MTESLQLPPIRKASVKPLFVFSGLNLVKKDRPFLAGGADSRAQKRSSAWDAYYKGQISQAASLFENAGTATRVLSSLPPLSPAECVWLALVSPRARRFARAEKYISLNFLTEVLQHFHAHGVEFMRAPYYSWPQVRAAFGGAGAPRGWVVCSQRGGGA